MQDPLGEHKQIVIYSPHYDDAYLAMGGYLGCCLNMEKRITNVIIFGRSNRIYKQDMPREKWEHASRIRLNEEKRNQEILRAELIVFPNNEALLRGYSRRQNSITRYPIIVNHDIDAVTRRVIAEQISSVLDKNQTALHLFPAAIGDHVDHQLVSPLVGMLPDLQVAWGVYEDQPYASKLISPIDLAPLQSVVLPVDMDKKELFIHSYRSQDAANWVPKIFLYMKTLSAETGVAAERIWLNSE